MNITELFLILSGLAIAAGGVMMLVRGANAGRGGAGVQPRPYIPLGVVAVGLVIAYHSYNDFDTLEPSDIAIMFLFALALATLMGLRFFIVERANVSDVRADDADRKTQDES